MKNIIISLIFSQIFILGVFWIERNAYTVIESQKEICGYFIPGTFETPNWLPNTWSSISCESEDSESCCEAAWFQYIWAVWDPKVAANRMAAEFLARKQIIEAQSFSPVKYQLENTITRKEMMKIIANVSQIDIEPDCNSSFQDVFSDWGCKYIEWALKSWFIAKNTNFRPDATLTQAEALKLIFQARKLERRYQTNSWQQDYISSAYYLWYITEKPNNNNTPATRSWIFQAIANTYQEF